MDDGDFDEWGPRGWIVPIWMGGVMQEWGIIVAGGSVGGGVEPIVVRETFVLMGGRRWHEAGENVTN